MNELLIPKIEERRSKVTHFVTKPSVYQELKEVAYGSDLSINELLNRMVIKCLKEIRESEQ